MTAAADSAELTAEDCAGHGWGPGGDAQHRFAEDILGDKCDHVPGHAKACRNPAAGYDRPRTGRIAACAKFRGAAASRTFADAAQGPGSGPHDDEAFLAGTGA